MINLRTIFLGIILLVVAQLSAQNNKKYFVKVELDRYQKNGFNYEAFYANSFEFSAGLTHKKSSMFRFKIDNKNEYGYASFTDLNAGIILLDKQIKPLVIFNETFLLWKDDFKMAVAPCFGVKLGTTIETHYKPFIIGQVGITIELADLKYGYNFLGISNWQNTNYLPLHSIELKIRPFILLDALGRS